jgi:hypothetical protein
VEPETLKSFQPAGCAEGCGAAAAGGGVLGVAQATRARRDSAGAMRARMWRFS